MGFPVHIGDNHDFFITELNKPPITWNFLHTQYLEIVEQLKLETPNMKALKYGRWLEYVHFFAPNIHLASAKEDVCDGCFAIDTELSNPSLSPERREELLALKHTHIEDAIIQRRAMQVFVKFVVKKEAPIMLFQTFSYQTMLMK